MRIYVAGAVFTPFERARNVRVADAFRTQGHDVFLPQSIRTPEGTRPERAEIFRRCVDGVDDADLVVGLVDGPDVDSGTAWEIGYAFAQQKPIITLRTDYRGAEGGPVNIMIEFCSDAFVERSDPLGGPSGPIDALVEAVTAWASRVRTHKEPHRDQLG